MSNLGFFIAKVFLHGDINSDHLPTTNVPLESSAHLSLPKMMSLICFFCPINIQNRKDFSFTVINEKRNAADPYIKAAGTTRC